MTPKQKAEEMYVHYLSTVRFNMEDCSFTYRDDIYELCTRKTAKRCALIAVDEVVKSLPSIVLVSVNGDEIEYPDREKYWQQVKKEIEQL